MRIEADELGVTLSFKSHWFLQGDSVDRQLCRDAIYPVPIACEVPCPKDCVLSPWTSWSLCSHTCSGKTTEGKQMRARSILAYNAGEGGLQCPNSTALQEVRNCNDHPCTVYHWQTGSWGQCIEDTTTAGSNTTAKGAGESSCSVGMQTRKVICVRVNVGQVPPKKPPQPPKQHETGSCGFKGIVGGLGDGERGLVPVLCMLTRDGLLAGAHRAAFKGPTDSEPNAVPQVACSTLSRAKILNTPTLYLHLLQLRDCDAGHLCHSSSDKKNGLPPPPSKHYAPPTTEHPWDGLELHSLVFLLLLHPSTPSPSHQPPLPPNSHMQRKHHERVPSMNPLVSSPYPLRIPRWCPESLRPDTVRPCLLPCKRDCIVTPFSDWTACPSTCQTGGNVKKKQSRNRIIIQLPANGGQDCPEVLYEEKDCESPSLEDPQVASVSVGAVVYSAGQPRGTRDMWTGSTDTR
ncbi:hypothetical protein JZ751_009760 [Albula glossodonta]|uniref:Spondin-like TSP1 domain-containing protein n=1 Tax=Albula glossodonta TaxID=121402 RepID=A0A8T2NY03_9TELE|nr:hypothetical protein JZ751_009760 [Albula glossodonta]